MDAVGEPPEPEFAFLLRPESWGQGLATEAGLAALAMLFERFSAPRVLGFVLPQNAAARHVLEKLGMRELRSIELRGKSVLLYAVIRLEWLRRADAVRP